MASLVTFIVMNVLMGPDCTRMPVEVTSSTLPSSTSSFSGLHAIASNCTLKITSPDVSWMMPSPILVSRPSSFHLRKNRKKVKPETTYMSRIIYPYYGLQVPTKVFSILHQISELQIDLLLLDSLFEVAAEFHRLEADERPDRHFVEHAD